MIRIRVVVSIGVPDGDVEVSVVDSVEVVVVDSVVGVGSVEVVGSVGVVGTGSTMKLPETELHVLMALSM